MLTHAEGLGCDGDLPRDQSISNRRRREQVRGGHLHRCHALGPAGRDRRAISAQRKSSIHRGPPPIKHLGEGWAETLTAAGDRREPAAAGKPSGERWPRLWTALAWSCFTAYSASHSWGLVTCHTFALALRLNQFGSNFNCF
jgi:hypothetical protein